MTASVASGGRQLGLGTPDRGEECAGGVDRLSRGGSGRQPARACLPTSPAVDTAAPKGRPCSTDPSSNTRAAMGSELRLGEHRDARGAASPTGTKNTARRSWSTWLAARGAGEQAGAASGSPNRTELKHDCDGAGSRQREGRGRPRKGRGHGVGPQHHTEQNPGDVGDPPVPNPAPQARNTQR